MVGRSLPVSPGIYTGRAKVTAGSKCGLLQSKDCSRLQAGFAVAGSKGHYGLFFFFILLERYPPIRPVCREVRPPQPFSLTSSIRPNSRAASFLSRPFNASSFLTFFFFGVK